MLKYDKKRRCMKCGHRGANTKFWDIISQEGYMRRKCGECGNTWEEEPLNLSTEESDKVDPHDSCEEMIVSVKEVLNDFIKLMLSTHPKDCKCGRCDLTNTY